MVMSGLYYAVRTHYDVLESPLLAPAVGDFLEAP
jgi:hypothetical protein